VPRPEARPEIRESRELVLLKNNAERPQRIPTTQAVQQVRDIRIEKTERAIREAFLDLRAHRPLEKIRVKDLCAAAQINKSTFYAHYQDIYALSDALEDAVIARILGSIASVADYSAAPDALTRALLRAFLENKQEASVLFSGRGQSHFADRIEEGLRARIDREDPDYNRSIVNRVILSFCVQGAYHAFANNSETVDVNVLVDTISRVAKAAQSAYQT
jgi:AcrR family transcriptional regulator